MDSCQNNGRGRKPRARRTATLKQAKKLDDLTGVKVVGERERRVVVEPGCDQGRPAPVAPEVLARAQERARTNGLEIRSQVTAGGGRTSGTKDVAMPDSLCYSFRQGRWTMADWYPGTARIFLGGVTGGLACAKSCSDIWTALTYAIHGCLPGPNRMNYDSEPPAGCSDVLDCESGEIL